MRDFQSGAVYLYHESERKKLADTGINLAHEQFNCVKNFDYMLDIIENRTYNVP
jgi:hypothetical protein